MMSPPTTKLPALTDTMRRTGWAVLDAADTAALAAAEPGSFSAWHPFWDDLPHDAHLRDGGRYRRRRHGCFVVGKAGVQAAPARAHWQPVEYNALHGGIERWFEPLAPALVQQPAWDGLLKGLAGFAGATAAPGGVPPDRWFVEAHSFRITTAGAGDIGRPTPEGAHRDGVDLVAVLLVGRHNVKGGETRVFDADGPHGMRFTLDEPWSVLLLDDARVVHESTPIQPLDPSRPGWRDTLVVTLRRGGFQGPDAARRDHDSNHDHDHDHDGTSP